MTRIFVKTGLLLLCTSCSYFKPEAKPEAIARVDESYLYKDAIEELVPQGTSKEDSVAIVRSYIDHWASQKLLIKSAELNLNDDQKARFDNLIRQYKIDLYTKAYLEELVTRSVDTIVSDAEVKAYYEQNKENFKTNGILVRLRYISLKKDNPRLATIRSKFLDFRKSDKKFWDTYGMQFNSFAFNDSVWVEMSQVYGRLPFINPENREQYIVPGKSVQHADSTDMYLVKVRDVLNRNQVSPLQYVTPTLREVIINKRKLELIQKFEKEIRDDAIKDKKYEIYK
ncbi:MAG TPA: hypothetical protein VF676_06315 [Flavobacterium sp.]|jgi:hypothetical protein